MDPQVLKLPAKKCSHSTSCPEENQNRANTSVIQRLLERVKFVDRLKCLGICPLCAISASVCVINSFFFGNVEFCIKVGTDFARPLNPSERARFADGYRPIPSRLPQIDYLRRRLEAFQVHHVVILTPPLPLYVSTPEKSVSLINVTQNHRSYKPQAQEDFHYF